MKNDCFRRADPNLVGMISGLTLDKHNLPQLYIATIQALACGTAEITKHMSSQGYSLDTIMLTGGMAKSDFFVQTIADATGCRVVLPKEPEAVLLGSAILASVASKKYRSVEEGMKAMTKASRIVKPRSDQRIQKYFVMKSKAFVLQYELQIRLRGLSDSLLEEGVEGGKGA